MVVNGESGCWFTGLNPALAAIGWNQVGVLRTRTGSRGGTEQGCAERPGQKSDCLRGLVPPGTMGETEARLGWGAVRLTRAGCWRLSDSRAGAQVSMSILPVLLSLCAQQDHSCHLAQLLRVLWRHKDILLVTIGTVTSPMENPIFQRTSGSLLVGNCWEICFYWMCFCSLEAKT